MVSAEIEGDWHMFGQRVSDNWPVYNAMNGVVLQNPAGQLSGLADTVADEIAFDLINQGMAEGLIQKRVEEVATQMGLIEQLNLRPESLSGGQIQRLAIATAIATNPAVLIMDDPTSQMDPLGRRQFSNGWPKSKRRLSSLSPVKLTICAKSPTLYGCCTRVKW